MPVVTAVSVSPTCAVPVMVGAPIAAVLGAVPLTAKKMRTLLLIQDALRMSSFRKALPMLHPIAAPTSAVLLAAVLT